MLDRNYFLKTRKESKVEYEYDKVLENFGTETILKQILKGDLKIS